MQDPLDWSRSSSRKTVERMVEKGLLDCREQHGLSIYRAKAKKIPTLAGLIRSFASDVLDLDGPLPVSNLIETRLLDAHALFKRWSQATEIRCDMAVTQSQTPRMRKAYAQTLMQALHIMAGRVRQYPAASFSTHRLRTERMRITRILDGTPPSFKRGRDHIGLMTIAISLTLAGTLGIAATATANPSKAKPFKAKSAKPVTSDMVDGRLTARFGLVPDPFKAGEPGFTRGSISQPRSARRSMLRQMASSRRQRRHIRTIPNTGRWS